VTRFFAHSPSPLRSFPLALPHALRSALSAVFAVGVAFSAGPAAAQVAEPSSSPPATDASESRDGGSATLTGSLAHQTIIDTSRGSAMLQAAGIRGIATDVSGGPLSGDATSVVFAIDQETSVVTNPRDGAKASARASTHAHIGGGTGGFDGMYFGQVTGGPRFGSYAHALAVRGGLGGGLRGNDRFYQSELALPVGELAYQAHPGRDLFFEAGISGGYVLIGRHNVDGIRRKLGNSGKAGGFALLGTRYFQLVGSVQRLFASSGPDKPIDTARASACLSPFMGLLFCGNFEQAQSAVYLPASAGRGPEQTTRTRFLGLSVGLGGLSVD
jgi:hypothetical protein